MNFVGDFFSFYFVNLFAMSCWTFTLIFSGSVTLEMHVSLLPLTRVLHSIALITKTNDKAHDCHYFAPFDISH